MKTFIITTFSNIYTIKNCIDSDDAIKKMTLSFDDFSLATVINIEEAC